MQKPKVFLVGAGPGDPGLLTVKALRLIQLADVILYDRLVSFEVLELANPQALFIYAGKEFGEQEAIQQTIYAAILEHARPGNTVVRLKSGDPLIFGRGGEELDFLAANSIEAEVVPGVSSALAGPALAGVPLTQRGTAASVAVVAGHRQSVTTIQWKSYAAIDSLVILMGVEHRDVIAGSLIQEGRSSDEPVLFIENVSTPRERHVESTLAKVASGKVHVESPAIFVIGEVVRLRHRAVRLAEQFA